MSQRDIRSEGEFTYTLRQLAEKSGVSERTIRYYTAERLLPPPLTRGRYAAYTEGHLRRLQLIDALKRNYLPLAEIRDRLAGVSDDYLAAVASQIDPTSAVRASASLAREVGHTPPIVRAPIMTGAAAHAAHVLRATAPLTAMASTSDTEPWRRIQIAPGIELHARAGLPPETERALGELVVEAKRRLVSGPTRRGSVSRHAHPRAFSLARHIDRGWGEIAFDYRWEASDGSGADESGELPSLAACVLYEVTTYAGNQGTYENGWFFPPDPPFAGWKFRDPTDGRTAEVGMECFIAMHGQAWDRHKVGGRLLPPAEPAIFTCVAIQTYRFTCDVCGADEIIPGPRGGPHEIIRTFAPSPVDGCWRYTIEKHGFTAWMDVDEAGFVADSLGLDFGPW